jgi:hypothetical protein
MLLAVANAFIIGIILAAMLGAVAYLANDNLPGWLVNIINAVVFVCAGFGVEFLVLVLMDLITLKMHGVL